LKALKIRTVEMIPEDNSWIVNGLAAPDTRWPRTCR
jgi:hypothetical protein